MKDLVNVTTRFAATFAGFIPSITTSAVLLAPNKVRVCVRVWVGVWVCVGACVCVCMCSLLVLLVRVFLLLCDTCNNNGGEF